MFRERQTGMGIFFSGDSHRGATIENYVENGDKVILKVGTESVLVKDVETLDNGKYRGIVYGFEPSFAQEFQGIAIDQSVDFEERNIISCSKKS